MRTPIALLRLACLACLAAPAGAQQGWRVIEVPQTAAERAEGGGGPLPQSRGAMLQQLAGTLGAVHYFAVACDGRDNQYWRERMMALLQAEAQDRYLRASMIEAFNDQYRERERAYPRCDGEASKARGQAAARGLMLSEALGEPYR